MYAPAGVGKTLLGLSMALAVAGGGRLLGWHAPSARRVLFVDGEMDMEDLQDRLRTLLPHVVKDEGAALENMVLCAEQDQDPSVTFPDLATDEGQTELLEIVDEYEPALVILDNFSTLCEVEDENSASSFTPIARLLGALKQRGVAAVLVHHARKDTKSYRGSSRMAVQFSSIMSLSYPNGRPSAQGARFTLRWEKYRQERDGGLIDLNVSLGGGMWHYEPLGDSKLEELALLLRSGDCPSQKALARRLGVTQGTISKWLPKAVEEGLIDAAEAAPYRKGGKPVLALNEDEEDADDF